MNEEGKKALALILPSLRISYGALLISAFKSSTGRDSMMMHVSISTVEAPTPPPPPAHPLP